MLIPIEESVKPGGLYLPLVEFAEALALSIFLLTIGAAALVALGILTDEFLIVGLTVLEAMVCLF